MMTVSFNIFNKLSFRLFSSITIVIVSIGISIYAFLLNPLSNIVKEIIHSSLTQNASQIQSICEQQYSDLLRSGAELNSPQAKVRKGLTLGLIEEFVVNHELNIIVSNKDLILAASENFALNKEQLNGLTLSESISIVTIKQKEFYAFKDSYSPWGWDFVILRDSEHYQDIITDLRRSYLATFLILTLGILFIFYIFLRQIQSPIAEIISALQKGEKPLYQGIFEIEYLSKCLRESLSQEEQKSHQLQAINRDLEKEIEVRKRTECELIENQTRFQSLYLNTPAMLHSIDCQGRIIHVSNYWLEKMDYTRDEVLGRKSTDFLTKESAEHAKEAVLPEFFNKGFCQDIPYQFVKKDGEVIDVLLSAILEKDKQGEPTQSLAVTTDITKQKRQKRKLIESEKKYRSLIETTDTGFVIQDEKGIVLDANQEYVRMSGHQHHDQIIGQSAYDWTAEYHKNKYAKQIAQCLGSNNIRHLEIDYVHKDNSIVPVEVNATIIQEEGQTEILSLLRDVSERKQNLLEKENLLKELHHAEIRIQREKMHNKVLAQSKLASLGQLATGVAHEINQPLSYIKIMLQAMVLDIEKGQLDVAELAQDSNYSLQQITRITQIINHLRTFGRDDDTVFSDIHLKEVIDNTLILMGQQLKLNDIDFSQSLSKNLPKIRGNSLQLEQVLINLFQNSIDALKGRKNKKVVLELDASAEHVYIRVTDNAGGIPINIEERIFEPFFTTKPQGEGTGIGLSIVFGIVNKHKGSIKYLAVPDGASFLITLPKVSLHSPTKTTS